MRGTLARLAKMRLQRIKQITLDRFEESWNNIQHDYETKAAITI